MSRDHIILIYSLYVLYCVVPVHTLWKDTHHRTPSPLVVYFFDHHLPLGIFSDPPWGGCEGEGGGGGYEEGVSGV